MKLKSKFLQFIFIYPIVVFFLSLLLRIYNLHNLFVFTIDEEYLFNFADTIARDFHIIWYGMTVSVGFYMGPLLVYLTAIIISLFKDPLVGGYFAAFLGAITTVAIFYIGKDIFNRKIAIIASLLYATLPLIVFFDQRYWNNTPITLLSILLFWTLIKIKKYPKVLIIYAIGIGLMFHTNLTLFPYLLVGLVLLVLNKRIFPKKVLIISLVSFLVLYSPLLVFDYFHNWDNLTLPAKLITTNTNNSSSSFFENINTHVVALLVFLGRLWFLNPGAINVDEIHWGCTSISGNNVPAYRDAYSTHTNPPLILTLLSTALLVIFLFSRSTWKEEGPRLLSIMIIIFIVVFVIFPGGALEYYLLPIFPLLVFIPGLILDKYKNKFNWVGYGLLGLIIVLGIFTVFKSDSQLGMGPQKRLISKVMKVINNQPFELIERGECRGFAGWRYLFKSYGQPPIKSSIDSTFGWLYPHEIKNDTKSVYTVIVEEKRAVPELSNKSIVEIFEEGGFRAYVIAKQD